MQLLKKALILVLFLVLFVGFALMAIQIKNGIAANTYSKYWQETSLSESAYTLVVMGDSTALGVGASKPENSVIGLVRDNIVKAKNLNVNVLNFAKQNASFEDVLDKQLPKIADKKVDMVLVIAGRQNVDKKRVDESKLSRLVSSLPSGISYIAEVPISYDGEKNKIAESINKVLNEEAARNGVIVIPLYRSTIKYQFDFSYYDWDFVHPNDKGQKIWAEAIESKL